MSGQELCYLCHQRAVHNVPISLAEERRLREMLQDKLLQDFQQRREALMMANEKVVHVLSTRLYSISTLYSLGLCILLKF